MTNNAFEIRNAFEKFIKKDESENDDPWENDGNYQDIDLWENDGRYQDNYYDDDGYDD